MVKKLIVLATFVVSVFILGYDMIGFLLGEFDPAQWPSQYRDNLLNVTMGSFFFGTFGAAIGYIADENAKEAEKRRKLAAKQVKDIVDGKR